MQFGEYLTTCSVTAFMISKLTFSRSSRLMPGLRGTPDVMTTTSEFGGLRVVGAADARALSEPVIGHDSSMSSATPCAF